jgi:hypothetical protein
MQHCGDECAYTAPHGQQPEKSDPILRKERSQHHDHCGADHRADHEEPALAQRRTKMRLTDDRRGQAGPKRLVELEPECDVKGDLRSAGFNEYTLDELRGRRCCGGVFSR